MSAGPPYPGGARGADRRAASGMLVMATKTLLEDGGSDIKQALAELRALGWSDAAIANAFGVGRERVNAWRLGREVTAAPGMLLLAATALKSERPPTGWWKARKRSGATRAGAEGEERDTSSQNPTDGSPLTPQ